MVGTPTYMPDFGARFNGGILGGGGAAPRGILGGGGGFLGQLLDPSVAFPAAAALIAGRNPQESLAGAFSAAGPGIVASRKRMLWTNYLKAGAPKDPNHPALRALIAESPEVQDKLLTSQLGSGNGGVYDGTSMDGQNWNIILGGKVDTPQYAAAYSQLFETPKMAPGQGPNGEITQTPYYPKIPQGVRPPAGYAAGAAPEAAAAPAAPGGPVPQGDGVRVGAPVVTGQKAPNEQNIRNRELYSVASKELPVVEENFDELSKLGNQAAGLGGDTTRWIASPGYQRAFMSLQTIVASYLYSTSGATANPGEVLKQTQVLMPAPLEAAASVADKKARVRQMVDAIKKGAQTTGGGDPGAAEAGWNEFGNGVKWREKP